MNQASIKEVNRLLRLKPFLNGQVILSKGKVNSKLGPCEIIICADQNEFDLNVYLKNPDKGLILIPDREFLNAIRQHLNNAGILITSNLELAESGLQTDTMVVIELNRSQKPIVRNYVRIIMQNEGLDESVS